MTQKLVPRNVGLKPTEIGHVDRVIVTSKKQNKELKLNEDFGLKFDHEGH